MENAIDENGTGVRADDAKEYILKYPDYSLVWNGMEGGISFARSGLNYSECYATYLNISTPVKYDLEPKAIFGSDS
jgi:hypothetical protein